MTDTKEGTVVPENDESVVSLSREEYDKLVEDRANDAQAKSNLTNEIIDLREKKQEVEEALKKASEKPADVPPVEAGELTPEKIAELTSNTVRNILKENDSEKASVSKEIALKEFQETHKEFHPDNDEAGLKRSALEKKLSMFSTDNLKTKEEFLSILESASKLLVDVKKEVAPSNPSAYSSPSANTHQKSEDEETLSSIELKIIERTFDGDKEKYLKQKAKRPEYVEQLLEWAK